MYPRLSDIFRDLFGFELPIPIYSFGAMVALGVLTAVWLTGKELDRLYRRGRLPSIRVEVRKKTDRGTKHGMVDAPPSHLMGTVTGIALVVGFAGAKLFHILENLDDFARAPLAMIFSTGGFTFFGGLVLAAIAIAWYVRRKGMNVPVIADAFAPGLMIAYGIGRIGCHLAGDGDWGTASSLADKPSWIPTWLWAETYPNNILNIDLAAPGVYPTSIYEFVMAAILFGVLWSLRAHVFRPGWLFSLYLLFAGAERLLIEQIRVNNTFSLLGMTVTQAEMIASVLILAGIAGLAVTTRRRVDASARSKASVSSAAAS